MDPPSLDDGTAADPYVVLGLPSPAAGTTHEAPPTDADIRRAFRRLALVKHPDKARGVSAAIAAAEFDALQKAYDALTDVAARAAWDELLRARAARAARDAARGAARAAMMADLAARERGEAGGVAAGPPSDEAKAAARLKAELARVRAAAAKAKAAAAAPTAPPPPPPGPSAAEREELARSLKVTWAPADGDYTAAELKAALEAVAPVAEVVVRPPATATAAAAAKRARKSTAAAVIVMASRAGATKATESVVRGVHGPLLVVPLARAATVAAAVAGLEAGAPGLAAGAAAARRAAAGNGSDGGASTAATAPRARAPPPAPTRPLFAAYGGGGGPTAAATAPPPPPVPRATSFPGLGGASSFPGGGVGAGTAPRPPPGPAAAAAERARLAAQLAEADDE